MANAGESLSRNSIPISPSSQRTRLYSVRRIPRSLNIYSPQDLTRPAAFKLTDQEVTDFYARQKATPIPGVPKFDARRVVDGQRKITFLKPLPTTSEGKKFTVRSKVLGVYDKGKAGTVVETEQLLVDETGEAYSRAVGSGFFVGQGNWGGPKGEGCLALSASVWVS